MDLSCPVVLPDAVHLQQCPLFTVGLDPVAVEVDEDLVLLQLEPRTMPIGGEFCLLGPPQASVRTAAPIVFQQIERSCVHTVHRVAKRQAVALRQMASEHLLHKDINSSGHCSGDQRGDQRGQWLQCTG